MLQLIGLAAATFISEDLACITAGALIHNGAIDAAAAVLACAAGIYLGDLGLYGLGRICGRRVLTWSRMPRAISASRGGGFERWFAEHGAAAIIASRFLPGTRLPLYLGCGALGGSFRAFGKWTFVATAVWTPILVLAASRSMTAAHPLVVGVALFMGLRVLAAFTSRRRRQRAISAISRLWRWEFWPPWIFYAPVATWILWLTVRHRGIDAIAAANPGMQDGGIVGESKHEILSRLPADFTLPAVLVGPGDATARMWYLLDCITHHGWEFPLVMKPDVGQRGAGVRIVHSLAAAGDYLAREDGAVVVQRYHPGPFEAGVFYYRMPDWSRGRILSITDKHFPIVIGDGYSTVEDLVWAHPRLRMQAHVFLARHARNRERVLAPGEGFALAVAGNHAQGTMFTDGRHLITPELEDRIDTIAATYPGFFVGRFDVRYSDVERFKAGEDLAIVELNGATAESTNIYDPAGSLVNAYRQLFRQWSIVFAIGAENRARGEGGTTWRRLFKLVRQHLTRRAAFASD